MGITAHFVALAQHNFEIVSAEILKQEATYMNCLPPTGVGSG